MEEAPVYYSPKWKHDVIYSDPQCLSCGRVIKEPKFFVHLLNSGEVVDTQDESIPDSQGLFDIGPECRKHYKPNFIFSNEN